MKHRFRALTSAVCRVALHSAGLGLVIVALSPAAWAVTTPEIDAGSLVSGRTLVTDAIQILTNRYRGKYSPRMLEPPGSI